MHVNQDRAKAITEFRNRQTEDYALYLDMINLGSRDEHYSSAKSANPGISLSYANAAAQAYESAAAIALDNFLTGKELGCISAFKMPEVEKAGKRAYEIYMRMGNLSKAKSIASNYVFADRKQMMNDVEDAEMFLLKLARIFR